MAIFHVLVCLVLVGVVLLQTGKGAEMGAAFGGSSQTLFGSYGAATFLSKLTVGTAALYFITSLGLTVLNKGRSVLPSITDTVATSTAATSTPATSSTSTPSMPNTSTSTTDAAPQSEMPMPAAMEAKPAETSMGAPAMPTSGTPPVNTTPSGQPAEQKPPTP